MEPDFRIGPEALKYFKLAYAHQMKGELDQALKYYEKSLAIEPTAEAYTFLGWTYSFMGKLELAIKACQKAIAIDPDFGNPYNDIGAYLLQLGQFDEAIDWLVKATKATRYENPEFPYCNLARIYELKGLWPLAIKAYHQALQIRKDYQPALMALLRLEAKLN
ncbi:MAG: tetratricopeptide repeat protein [bacterium]